jgi:LmbE family N-acetylglucosaminyl deacetylase/Flp pilus assembly protein TadD
VTVYRDVIEQDPLNLAGIKGLARVMRWATRYAEAERFYSQVLRAEPEDVDALIGLATTYAQQRNFDLALRTIDRARNVSPGNPEVIRMRGDILAWGNRYAEAEESYNEALALEPESAGTLRSLGDLYRWAGKYARAADALSRAQRLDARNTEVLVDLANVSIDAGLYRQAEETVKRLFALDPNNSHGYEILRRLDSRTSIEYAELINGYAKPGFLLLSNIVIGLYFWKRRDRLNARGWRIMKWFYRVWPALAVVWIAVFVAARAPGVWGRDIITETAEFATLALWMIAFVTLVWLTRIQQRVSGKAVLAIGAHPDDIELGCGGTLSRYKDMGFRVYGLVVTSGEAGNPHGNDRIDRRGEAENGAAVLGLDGLWIYRFRDAALYAEINEIKDVIETRIRETGAEIIITQSPYDVHQDHKAVFEATKIAARGDKTILCYEDVSSEANFTANYFVDITGYIEDKISAVGAHRTQKEKPYMNPERISGRAAHRGLQTGVRFAEAFVLYRGCDLWLSS